MAPTLPRSLGTSTWLLLYAERCYVCTLTHSSHQGGRETSDGPFLIYIIKEIWKSRGFLISLPLAHFSLRLCPCLLQQWSHSSYSNKLQSWASAKIVIQPHPLCYHSSHAKFHLTGICIFQHLQYLRHFQTPTACWLRAKIQLTLAFLGPPPPYEPWGAFVRWIWTRKAHMTRSLLHMVVECWAPFVELCMPKPDRQALC